MEALRFRRGETSCNCRHPSGGGGGERKEDKIKDREEGRQMNQSRQRGRKTDESINQSFILCSQQCDIRPKSEEKKKKDICIN